MHVINFGVIYFRLKDKVNHAPERRDYQKVSHTLARFIKLKEDAKKQSVQKKKFKRKTIDNEDKPGKLKFSDDFFLGATHIDMTFHISHSIFRELHK